MRVGAGGPARVTAHVASGDPVGGGSRGAEHGAETLSSDWWSSGERRSDWTRL